MSWGAIIIGGGTLAYGAIKEGEAKKKGRQLGNSRPKEQPSPEIAEEEALTASQLSNENNPSVNGQDADQDRALSSSLNTILKAGGDPNSISSLFTSDQVGRQRMALMREGIRLQKTNNFIGALRERSGEREQEFGFNDWAPWLDQSEANGQAKQYGTNLESQGLNTIGSGIAGYASNKSTEKLLDGYFKGGSMPSQPKGPVTNTSAASYTATQPNPSVNVNPGSQTWKTPTFTPLSGYNGADFEETDTNGE